MTVDSLPTSPARDALYWLTSKQLEELSGCALQVVQKAILRATQGHTWHGATLAVRKQGRAYLVDARTLPPDLYHKFWEANREALAVPAIAPNAKTLQPVRAGDRPEVLAKQYREAEWKVGIIMPALQYRSRSAGRGELLRSIAERTHVRPTDGKPMRFTEAKLRAFCRLYEEGGVRALMRKERALETKPRRLVNRKWDQECPLALPEKTRLAEEIARYVRGLWVSGGASRSKVRLMASAEFARLCREAGWSEATINNCDVGQHLVEMHQDARPVSVHDRDAKRYSDIYQPRIARTRSELMPGEAIVGDVHPLDILLSRADGSTYTPRMIAWYDLATNRCFYTLLHPEPGRSVTQADVTRSFVDLCMAWGVPSKLYLDNGPEYIGAELVDGFYALKGMGYELELKLNEIAALEAKWAADLDEAQTIDADQQGGTGDGRALIRAKPYNAAAKPVEGAFSAKEKVLSMLPGYIGGDRMNKHVGKVGREPDPYPGTAEAFDRAFAEAMAFFHNLPQRGHLGGVSPNERYEAMREQARVTRAEMPVFLLAFSVERQLKVRTQGVQLGAKEGGKWYMADALVPLIGTRQTFRIAKWRPEAIILARRINGKRAYDVIHERRAFGFFDPEGAKEAARLNALRKSHIRYLRGTAPNVDLQESMRNYVAEKARVTGDATPAPGPNDRHIGLSTELQAMDRQLRGDNPNPVERVRAGEFLDKEGAISRLEVPAKAQEPMAKAALLPDFKYEKPTPRTRNPFDNFEEEYEKEKARKQRERSGGPGSRQTDLIQPFAVAGTIDEA